MAKRILVVPDVHGRTFWKEPVSKYIDQTERIVFLGDYLDPYRDEGIEYTPKGVYDNLMEIIQLKLDNMKKMIMKRNKIIFTANKYIWVLIMSVLMVGCNKQDKEPEKGEKAEMEEVQCSCPPIIYLKPYSDFSQQDAQAMVPYLKPVF